MDIGEKLRLLRIRRGLTQEDMADRCELSKGFISQVERNLASPSIATDRKSTRLNSSHPTTPRMPSSA